MQAVCSSTVRPAAAPAKAFFKGAAALKPMALRVQGRGHKLVTCAKVGMRAGGGWGATGMGTWRSEGGGGAPRPLPAPAAAQQASLERNARGWGAARRAAPGGRRIKAMGGPPLSALPAP